MIKKNVLELIGNTPVIQLKNLVEEDSAKVYVKLEGLNLTGSIKIRPAYYMIKEAIESKVLKPGNILVEATSGNMGIALAYIANILGYEIHIVMPDTMSIERRQIMQAYNAKLILTDGALGMKGAIAKANELAKEDNYVLLQQFDNIANTKSHYETTATELINDFNNIDVFVAGIGTGGTITGVGNRLKKNYENIKIIGIEPTESPIISKNISGSHKIQGIGAGFIPSILDTKIIDDIIRVESEKALSFTKEIYLKEGLFLGISSAANIFVALDIASKLDKDKVVVTVAPDDGTKYLTNNIFIYDN